MISSSDYSSTDEKPLAKKQRISIMDIEKIIMGVERSDSHITAFQKNLKHQFPHLNGLESTLSQLKRSAANHSLHTTALLGTCKYSQ